MGKLFFPHKHNIGNNCLLLSIKAHKTGDEDDASLGGFGEKDDIGKAFHSTSYFSDSLGSLEDSGTAFFFMDIVSSSTSAAESSVRSERRFSDQSSSINGIDTPPVVVPRRKSYERRQ